MRAAGQRLAWLLCLLLAAGNVVLAYVAFPHGSTSLPVAVPVGLAVTSQSAAMAASPVAANDLVDSQGHISPAQRSIAVYPLVSGPIVSFPVKEGQRVAKGEILAQLDDAEYRTDCERATAVLDLAKHALRELEQGNRPEEIAQARSDLAEAEAQLAQLEAEWKRCCQLHDRRVLSNQDYELTQSRYRAMSRRVEKLRYGLRLAEMGPREERIAMARAQVRQAEADLAKAQMKLECCTIRAPSPGTILKKNVEEGTFVNPMVSKGPDSICEMASLTSMEAELLIREQDVSRVFVGKKCRLHAVAYPQRTYEGTVVRLGPMADRGKGVIPAYVQVNVPPSEEGEYLKPQMRAVVSFLDKKVDGGPFDNRSRIANANP